MAKEAWSEQKVHKKVLDRGKPEDAMPGLKNTKETLPSVPLSGMLNKSGGKVGAMFLERSNNNQTETRYLFPNLGTANIQDGA